MGKIYTTKFIKGEKWMKNSLNFRKNAIIGLISLLTVSSLPFNGDSVRAADNGNDNVITEFSKMKEVKKKIEIAKEDFKDSDKVRVIVEF